jgi:hypothetical protein
MGVETEFFIMPQASHYRPSPDQVITLISRLRATKYLADPAGQTFKPDCHRGRLHSDGTAVHEGFEWQMGRTPQSGSLKELRDQLAVNADKDIKIRWPNSDLQASGLLYPLSSTPDSEAVYFDIEFHLAKDTVYYLSEMVEPFDEPVQCKCGRPLASFDAGPQDLFYSARLPNECTACHTTTDFSNIPMILRDAWTGDEVPFKGGVTYRFAVVIDCGKMHPAKGADIADGFSTCLQETLNCPTRVVQNFD